MEAAVCERVDAALVCSGREQSSFDRLWPGGRYITVPNGVDSDYFQPGNLGEEQAGVLVFTGAMGYWPNEEAAIYFCKDILPILQRMGRKIKVYFVGKGPTLRVQALHDGDSVFVTGQVDDVRPYIRRAEVVVVPLRHGAGTRLKILEAFAMGKAVVSTTLGAEGIPAENDREILLADDPMNFASKITLLLDQRTEEKNRHSSFNAG